MRSSVASILSSKFAAPCVARVIEHYEGAVRAYRVSQPGDSLESSGKFSEAVLRTLHHLTTGDIVDRVDVGAEIDRLERLPRDLHDESIRLLIPRALRVLYQVACNRGARHDRVGFDPNQMDATLGVALSSWVLAELVRIALPGVLEPTAAHALVAGIVEPHAPILETVDGLMFLHKKSASAREVVLVRLRGASGERLPREELLGVGKLHGHSEANVRATLSQLRRSRLIHENSEGIRLLSPGLAEAEHVLRDRTS